MYGRLFEHVRTCKIEGGEFLKNLIVIINSIIAAFVATLITLTGAFLYMLFNGGGEVGKRTIFFKALFFDNVEKKDGTVKLNFGVENFTPIIIVFAVYVVIFIVFFQIYNMLKNKQDQLRKEINHL